MPTSILSTFDFQQTISAFIILFAVIDIIGSIPILINLRENGRKVNALQATLISFMLMLGFFYAGTYMLALFHGLSSLINEACFKEEVLRQRNKIKELFGKTPKVFRNSSLIYSDEIGAMVADMGFKGVLTEGARHILGWKSPHYVYQCATDSNLKLLLRDYKLSDDISLRFSNSEWNEYPLFADKYIEWIEAFPVEEQVFNIFMEMGSIGMTAFLCV